MKSRRVRELTDVFAAVFIDVCKWNVRASAGEELEILENFTRDWLSISAVIESRGLPILLVEAPSASKHLLRCLEAGHLLMPSEPSFWLGGISSTDVPTVLGYLWRRIFDDSGVLRPNGPRVGDAIRDLRQLLSCLKKIDEECPQQAIDLEIDSFVSTDRALPLPSSFWEKDTAETDSKGELKGVSSFILNDEVAARADEMGLDPASVTMFLKYLDFVSGWLHSKLGPYDWHEWSFKHGPGQVADLRTGEWKYRFPTWSAMLDSAFSYDDAAFSSLSSWAYAAFRDRLASDEEVPSVLRAVPKDMTKPRLIAKEATANMWCQQNMLDYMFTRTSKTILGRFVQFHDQSLNQGLAREGSLTGRLATVDLSAASDRVTCTVVASWCRSNPTLLCALRAARTRHCETPAGVIPLRKYATMGNATTFPVQSLLFLSIALASVLHARKSPACEESLRGLVGEVAVFGDDIIVPVDCRSSFETSMNLLWFKLNADKTFWNGSFRESCGLDAYFDQDVTPVYVKSVSNETPDDVASLVDQSNAFYSKGLYSTAKFLASRIERLIPLRSPSSGAFGLTCRTGGCLDGFKTRYNHHLQRDEVKVPCPHSSSRTFDVEDETSLLQFFTERPELLSKWEAGRKRKTIAKITMEWRAVTDYMS